MRSFWKRLHPFAALRDALTRCDALAFFQPIGGPIAEEFEYRPVLVPARRRIAARGVPGVWRR